MVDTELPATSPEDEWKRTMERGLGDLMSMVKMLTESNLQKKTMETPTGPTPEKRTVSEANRLRKGKTVAADAPRVNLFEEGLDESITIAPRDKLTKLGGKSKQQARQDHERTERRSAFDRLGTSSTSSTASKGKSNGEKALEDEVRGARTELRRERGRTGARRGRRSRTPEPQQNESPFTQEILDHELPKNFVMPNMDTFDGSKDPNDHLVSFKTKMCLMNAPDAILCKAFPTTLKGPAAAWYNNLEPGSVYSFPKMSRLFLSRFAATLKPRKSATYLFTVKQGGRETVKSYLAKFNTELLQVEKPDDKIAVTAFMEGLQPSTLLYSFAKNPPNSMAEMLDKAQAHIMAEDHMKCRAEYRRDLERSRDRERPRRRSREDERSGNRTRDRGGRDGGRNNRNRGEYEPKYRRYAPLNASTNQIFAVIRKDPKTPWPEPIKGGKGKKYCEYHRSKGHDTSVCMHLRDEIERRIRAGDLKQFQADDPEGQTYDLREQLVRSRERSREHRSQSRSRSSERTRSPRRGPPLERNQGSERSRGRDVINSIFGGFASGGTSNSQRKNHARKVARTIYSANSVGESARQLRCEPITFTDKDLEGISIPHDDPLVLELVVANKDVKRVLVDGGSSVDIIWLECFQKMGIGKDSLKKYAEPVFGFSGEKVYPLGSISLEVTVGTKPRTATVMTEFLVMDGSSAFNMIIGRPTLHALQAVHSTFHQVLKFPTKHGVGAVIGMQRVARECYNNSFRAKYKPVCQVGDVDPRAREGEAASMDPADDTVGIPLSEEEPERKVLVCKTLPDDEKARIIELLRSYVDVFAWSHADMPGIPRTIIEHELSVISTCKPYIQKRRPMSPEKNLVIYDEVSKLLAAGFIREVRYPEWIANVVLVKKANGKWRMCVDFTNLNKACPKDCFPLPKIDALVDGTAGHVALSFLDAYSGYNQVKLKKEDEEKTTFITDRGTYCYTVMPFGVKNGCATFQRLVNEVFADLIGHTMEVYIDDMLVKSKRLGDHVTHLEECLERVRACDMRLNPEKCVFGVSAGKFLGFLVSNRGIEANPIKIQALIDIPSPKTVRQVQALTGRVAALNRFVSRATDKCLPFFQVIKQAGKCSSKHAQKISWNEECEEALQELKRYMASPPLLSSPVQGETLFIYLAVSVAAVSSVLIREDNGTQLPVYYTSRSLKGAESRYPRYEKLAFALLTAARRLRPYFQAHPIVVYTDQPLRAVLHKSDTSGRLIKWCVELGEFDITYLPRTAIKGQALADFLVELDPEEEMMPHDTEQSQEGEDAAMVEAEALQPTWILFVDGSATTTKSGAGLVLSSPEGLILKYSLAFKFKATNNEAEYEAVLAGLRIAKAVGAEHVEVRSDSQLVVNQVLGEYEAREENMVAYSEKTKAELAKFKTGRIVQIPREQNFAADALARMASASETGVYVEELETPSIDLTGGQVLQMDKVTPEPSWMDPIVAYLREGTLPELKEEARRLKKRAAMYYLSELYPGVLFKRGFSAPDLRCVDPQAARGIISEIHQGDCGNHSGGRSLALKALRQGYFWPTMVRDAKDFVQKCDDCQRFAFDLKQPPETMTPVAAPWPFAQWGIDITGPFPPAAGQVKFLIVAVDYFTKWVEAQAVPTITAQRIVDFVWTNIVCRFGVPRAIVSDNGKQFNCAKFKDFCEEKGIRNYFATPYHPQANGQVEAMNKTLIQNLKKKLSAKKGDWPEYIPEVLWAHRTTPRESTGETPFSLAFGAEAVIPAEVNYLSVRTLAYEPEENERSMRDELDLLEEKREMANLRNAAYKLRISKYYNSRVRPRTFKVGDLVLKKVNQSTKEVGAGKLGPGWEGPYTVIRVGKRGAYELEDRWGCKLDLSWNAEHLKKYYQ